MNAPLPQFPPARSSVDPCDNSAGLAAGWTLLAEAGDAIARLAQLGPDSATIAPGDFAMRVAAAGPVRLRLTERAIDDCAAALHCGLTALIAATDRGRDCTAAALTLWREFDRSRSALLALSAPRH